MKYNNILVFSAVLFSQYGFAQWQASALQSNFSGTTLSQQYSQNAIKSINSKDFVTLSYFRDDHEEVTDIFDRDQGYEGLSFTSSNKISSDYNLFHSTSVSKSEQHLSSLFSSGSWHFGASAGRGENFVKANQSFSGIDPYFIHGGSAVAYEYYGFNSGVEISNDSLLYVGSSSVFANKLDDRAARYVGYQSSLLSATMINFERANETIGKGYDVSINLDKFNFGYNQISRVTGAHSKRFSFNFDSRKRYLDRLGFMVESTNNPLNRNEDDLSFLLTFSGQWGKSKPLFNIDEPVEQEQGPRINKMAVIGVGVVAGALIASSGSSSKDNQEIFVVQAQDDAAFRVLNSINPISVQLNREHGGYIYRNPNGSYGFTQPKLGQAASINLSDVFVPNGTQRTASYHTHAGPDPRFDNENFSPTDIQSDNATGIDGYLGTPRGTMKHHDVETDRIRTVRPIAN